MSDHDRALTMIEFRW